MTSQHPIGVGLWPAFWLMPEGIVLEIDIFATHEY